MARNKLGLQGELFKDYMAKLDELGGTKAMIKGVESALTESKKYLNPKVEKIMNKSNLPASGKYSTGGTLESLDYTYQLEAVSGYVYGMKIGFNFNESGLKSIFLMYGTPRMKPVKGLKSVFYGNMMQKEISLIQADAINKEVKRIMEG